MTKEDFAAVINAKNVETMTLKPGVEGVEQAITDTLAAGVLFRGSQPPVASAFDPTFIITLLQILGPLFLAWVNRRFPQTPVTPPTP